MSRTPVYSTPFVQWTASAGSGEYEVPDGYTAVIRQLSIVLSAGAIAVIFQGQDSPEAPAFTYALLEAEGVYNQNAQEGRWVIPGGGLISCQFTGEVDGWNVYVGGYLLEGNIGG